MGFSFSPSSSSSASSVLLVRPRCLVVENRRGDRPPANAAEDNGASTRNNGEDDDETFHLRREAEQQWEDAISSSPLVCDVEFRLVYDDEGDGDYEKVPGVGGANNHNNNNGTVSPLRYETVRLPDEVLHPCGLDSVVVVTAFSTGSEDDGGAGGRRSGGVGGNNVDYNSYYYYYYLVNFDGCRLRLYGDEGEDDEDGIQLPVATAPDSVPFVWNPTSGDGDDYNLGGGGGIGGIPRMPLLLDATETKRLFLERHYSRRRRRRRQEKADDGSGSSSSSNRGKSGGGAYGDEPPPTTAATTEARFDGAFSDAESDRPAASPTSCDVVFRAGGVPSPPPRRSDPFQPTPTTPPLPPSTSTSSSSFRQHHNNNNNNHAVAVEALQLIVRSELDGLARMLAATGAIALACVAAAVWTVVRLRRQQQQQQQQQQHRQKAGRRRTAAGTSGTAGELSVGNEQGTKFPLTDAAGGHRVPRFGSPLAKSKPTAVPRRPSGTTAVQQPPTSSAAAAAAVPKTDASNLVKKPSPDELEEQWTQKLQERRRNRTQKPKRVLKPPTSDDKGPATPSLLPNLEPKATAVDTRTGVRETALSTSTSSKDEEPIGKENCDPNCDGTAAAGGSIAPTSTTTTDTAGNKNGASGRRRRVVTPDSVDDDRAGRSFIHTYWG